VEVGSPAWLGATGGALARRERARLLLRIAAELPTVVVERVRVERWRRRASEGVSSIDPAVVPRSAVALEAIAVCEKRLSPSFVNHSYRTWIFGLALAERDDAFGELDAEGFFVAAMLHDVGLGSPRFRCCFTLAGVEATQHLDALRSPVARGVVALAIADHITPGISRRTNPLGFYLQRGSLLDLTGIRAAHLPRDFVSEAFERHPAGDIRAEVAARWRAEAVLVRHGRADLLQRCGRFGAMTRFSPLPPAPD
jgi:hypothetical protein